MILFFRFIDIKKTFIEQEKKKNVLNGINLDINEGDFISFVGPSGAGKSTLLLILAGLIKPSSGDIYFDSKKLTKLSDKEWSLIRKEYMGIIFQKKIFIPHLKVMENILAPISFRNDFSQGQSPHDKVGELLELFNLTVHQNKYPEELSGGELQRMMIVRSLITEPKILLADEPTGDLDINASKEIINSLKKINKKGLTIIMVTHNKDLALLSKNIYRIEQGEIKKLIK